MRSPKKSLRTMLRLYQARGNAKISVKRLMSYLNEAEPISTMAEKKDEVVILIKYNFISYIFTGKSYSGMTLIR